MFTFAPLKKRFSLGTSKNKVDIPAVEIHDIETSTDRRARTLKHLLKANHANHAIIYHNLEFNNHMPHILGAAYILGADQNHMNDIYDHESTELEPWKDAPGEITLDDWQEFLGKKHYQRAYIDFFEDQLVRFGYDWEELVRNFLFEGSSPLINNLIAGRKSLRWTTRNVADRLVVAHPLIHLGYAYELHSQSLTIEALAMVCCDYDFLHKYIDQPMASADQEGQSKSLLEILNEVRKDQRFNGLRDHGASGNIEKLFTEHEAAVLEHWSSWALKDPKRQFQESQTAAAALLIASKSSTGAQLGEYDFFLVHLLTSSHAVRVLLPLIPSEFHASVIRQWWLLALAVYITQGRPEIDVSMITNVDTSNASWKSVEHAALTGKHALDSHYVKAIRALKEAAKTWGDEDELFLKAAAKFSNDFTHWGFSGLS